MLEAGDEPIEAIAREVGYEDAGFFSRLFRRKVNLTPAQYRKRFGSLRKCWRATSDYRARRCECAAAKTIWFPSGS